MTKRQWVEVVSSVALPVVIDGRATAVPAGRVALVDANDPAVEPLMGSFLHPVKRPARATSE